MLASERRFVYAMRQVQFGRFESLPINRGELVLDPWPTCIRDVKFGSDSIDGEFETMDFDLKRQIVEFLQYVRAVDVGEIYCLTVRHGLPFSMEVLHKPGGSGGDIA